MGLFGSRKSDTRYGANIDVGSASVVVAIVRSKIGTAHPTVVWSRREFVLQNTTQSIEQSSKNVMTALINAVLALGKDGVRALAEAHPGASIANVQVNIGAPWSYTITKTIAYSNEGRTFKVTKGLIDDLAQAARRKVAEELDENELAEQLGLVVIARTTTDLIVNGYRSESPFGEQAKSLSLAHISAVAQQTIVETVEDVQQKILPGAAVERFSSMLVYYCVLRELHPSVTEFCIVDVTYEATELGVVRDGVLWFTTHLPFGSYSIAREIAAACNLPHGEAFALLKADNQPLLDAVPAGKREAVEQILATYESKVAELFQQTGDSLSIPKSMFLHCGFYLESRFKTHITNAARAATGSSHTAHEVTADMLTKRFTAEEKQALLASFPDTSLLVSAQFFHKQQHCQDLEQL